jgi:hypothetical protein
MRFAPVEIELGHDAENIDAEALTQDDVILQVPTRSPPHAAVLAHAPLPPPEPGPPVPAAPAAPEPPAPDGAMLVPPPQADIVKTVVIAHTSIRFFMSPTSGNFPGSAMPEVTPGVLISPAGAVCRLSQLAPRAPWWRLRRP